jgi:heme oxygenase (biliverdin-producing, ferredoxin)
MMTAYPHRHRAGAPLVTELPERLRLGTRDLHQQTERTGFMADFLAGRIDRAGYCALLRNLHAIYATLETALARQPGGCAVLPLDAPALHREQALAADLLALHGPRWREELPLQSATVAYVTRLQALAAADSVALAAHAYVRYLGDLHGGQVLKRLVARNLGLQGPQGTRFYDYGSEDEVLALRNALRRALAELPVDAEGIELILAEARWAFAQHCAIFEQLSD